MRHVVLLIAGLTLAACSGEGVVPPVAVETPATMTPISGNYAATVVSGHWNLQARSDGYACGAWTVATDVDPAYDQSMRAALTRTLERVTFVSGILTPEQLKAQGYDAQIVIGQGKAESSFAVTSTLMRGSISSDVSLSVILAIQDEKDAAFQQTISARGRGESETSYCSSIGEAIGGGAQEALAAIARQVVLYVRDELTGRQLAKATAVTPPSAEPPSSTPIASSGNTMASPPPSPSQPTRPTQLIPRAAAGAAGGAEASKQAELQRDLAREMSRGDGAPAAEESNMTSASGSAAGQTGAVEPPEQAAALPPSAPAPMQTPSSLQRPNTGDAGGGDTGVTVAPIAPGASFNSQPKGAGEEAFLRGVNAAAGRGAAKSDAEAVKWYRAAANQGYAPAENNLGFLYAEGRGVARDDAEAVRWYKRAADRGYAPAQTSLGMMYAQGRGVAQSDFEALSLYSAAANQGFPQAKANLAEMYAQGRGVPRDERTASFLLSSVRERPRTGSGVYVEPPAQPQIAPTAAPGQ